MVKFFDKDNLHPENSDSMSSTHIAHDVALSLSGIISGSGRELQSYQILTSPVPTLDECKQIFEWSKKSGELLYLLFGSR